MILLLFLLDITSIISITVFRLFCICFTSELLKILFPYAAADHFTHRMRRQMAIPCIYVALVVVADAVMDACLVA